MVASKTHDMIAKNLNAIREVIDRDTQNDIELVRDKVIQLAMIAGLAAECQASAKKRFDNAVLAVTQRMIEENEKKEKADKIGPSILLDMAKRESSEEAALYEYAQRISAGLSHSLEGLRSVLSLYKTELQNSLNA